MSLTKTEILEYLNKANVGNINLMEVCGTHTMSIAKAGIRNMLPENIKLLSGPGCPVCVTPQEVIDQYLELSMRPDVIITTYGDMIRVPGSKPGDNLALRRAKGAKVQVVYSPMDAIDIARKNPDKEVVFLGVGFETTAPGTAACVKASSDMGVRNFSVFSMLKRVEPSLRALIADPAFNVQGFMVPGHVAVIIGEEGFKFLADEYHIPSVVTGFEPEDILRSIYRLVKQIEEGRADIENEYKRLVSPGGNKLAMDMIEKSFAPAYDVWRGLGGIPESGLAIKDEFSDYDAVKKFNIPRITASGLGDSACKCGEVIKGQLDPAYCPLFGKRCIPEDPVGPCMVSSEGACAAAYKYRMV